MSELIKQEEKVEVQVNIAMDVPCYQSVYIEVSKELLDTDKSQELGDLVAATVKRMEREDELGTWEPSWESSNQLRVISTVAGKEGGSKVVTSEIPIEVAYYDIAAALIGLVREASPEVESFSRSQLLEILRDGMVGV